MPMIHYICHQCGFNFKKLFRRSPFPSTLICEKCNGSMTKELSAPSQSSKISVDNGVQARRVEISPDIIETNEARSNKNYREE
jgi:putative FmdB family regulatory protein